MTAVQPSTGCYSSGLGGGGAGGGKVEPIKRNGGSKAVTVCRRQNDLYKDFPKVCQISARICSPYTY